MWWNKGENQPLHPCVFTTLREDANKDTKRNLGDVIFLVNYLFKGGASPQPKALGNVNCDKNFDLTDKVNLADVIYMVNYLFKGGKPPCS